MRPTARTAATAVALATLLAACGGSAPPPASTPAPPAAAPAASAPPAPATDARAEVKAAMDRFLALRSYHATMRIKGGAQGMVINEADFVAPDRYRILMPGVGTQTIVGDTMYMQMHGRTMKVPMPAGTRTQWRDPARMAGNEATMTIEDAGTDTVGTESAHKYLIHHRLPHPVDVTMWVGAQGLPLQLVVSSQMQGNPVETSIRYARFDDPAIAVDVPK